MKKIALFSLLTMTSVSFWAFQSKQELSGELTSFTKAGYREYKQESFKRGEKLVYRLHYGIFDAGEATMHITEEQKEIGGRKTLHMLGVGVSKGTFNWFYKVNDRYESYVDEQSMLPLAFVRRVNEGGYIINQDYAFNHPEQKVNCGEGKVMTVPEGIQDMLSAFYFARTMDFSNAKIGEVFTIQGIVDQEVFPVKIRYAGKEEIETDLGKFKTIKFHPVLQKGRIFKSEDDLNVWITDDKNHIPLRAQAKILVGSIKMDLTSYSGLANPVSKVE